MGTKTITCQECGIEKDIRVAEYNRKTKKGTSFFCSLSCAGVAANRTPTSKAARLLYNTSEKNLSNLANCRKVRTEKVNRFNYFLKNSKRRGKEFTMTLEYLENIWELQGGKCALSGVTMELPLGTVGFQSAKPLLGASLDRIDSSKGYIEGNVQFICSCLNLMKNSWDNGEFLEGFDKIAKSYIRLKYDVTI